MKIGLLEDNPELCSMLKEMLETGGHTVSAYFDGSEFLAVGRVVRSGRTVTVVTGELRSGEMIVAVLQGTMMSVRGRDISD